MKSSKLKLPISLQTITHDIPFGKRTNFYSLLHIEMFSTQYLINTVVIPLRKHLFFLYFISPLRNTTTESSGLVLTFYGDSSVLFFLTNNKRNGVTKTSLLLVFLAYMVEQ